MGFYTGKRSTVRARIEPDLKDKAEYVFRRPGLTVTPAITLFCKLNTSVKGYGILCNSNRLEVTHDERDDHGLLEG